MELDESERARIARANDDWCQLDFPDRSRHFVRGVLPVAVDGDPEGLYWGLWAEVSERDFFRIVWSDATDDAESTFDAKLANVVDSYPSTLGLALTLKVDDDPSQRPRLRFAPGNQHPFAVECMAGVDAHRAAEWGALMRPRRQARQN